MTQTGCSADETRQGGFVLVFVLGMLLLIALVSAGLMVNAQLQAKARRALNANLETAALADGLVRLIAFRLGEQRGGASLPQVIAVDGRPLGCRVGDADVLVRVQDQAGLVDLNLADTARLAALLRGVGADGPAGLAEAIKAFREPGSGAVAAYRRAGLAHGPKAAPYEAVDELDQVLGMTPAVLDRLRPLVTVLGTDGEVDPAVAPEAARVALSLPAPSSVPTGATVRRGQRGRSRFFGIEVTVRLGGNAQVRRAEIEFNERFASGFLVRGWATGSAGAAVAAVGTIGCI